MPLIFMEEVEVTEKNKYRLLKFTVVGSNRILAYIDQTITTQVTNTLDLDVVPILLATGGVDQPGKLEFSVLVSPPRKYAFIVLLIPAVSANAHTLGFVYQGHHWRCLT